MGEAKMPWTQEQTIALSRIKHSRDILTRDQYLKLKGQVKDGQPRAAMRGLRSIKEGRHET